MSCNYNYYEIYDNYLRSVNELLLDNTDINKPYPIYASRDDYNNDTTHDFKGLLVYNAQKYYAGFTGTDTTDEYNDSTGFYVIIEYGQVEIRRNIEYQQVILYTFDSNSDADYDPYQNKIIKEIDWFINKHKQLIDDINYTLPDITTLYVNVSNISKPIYVPENTTYVRRTVTVVLRYCICG